MKLIEKIKADRRRKQFLKHKFKQLENGQLLTKGKG
jgi:hypothetical protein